MRPASSTHWRKWRRETPLRILYFPHISLVLAVAALVSPTPRSTAAPASPGSAVPAARSFELSYQAVVGDLPAEAGGRATGP